MMGSCHCSSRVYLQIVAIVLCVNAIRCEVVHDELVDFHLADSQIRFARLRCLEQHPGADTINYSDTHDTHCFLQCFLYKTGLMNLNTRGLDSSKFLDIWDDIEEAFNEKCMHKFLFQEVLSGICSDYYRKLMEFRENCFELFEYTFSVNSSWKSENCKSQSLKLAPFLNFVILYFVFVQNPQGELWTTLLKCAPIVSLMFFVVTKGFGFTTDYRYSQLVLLGLIFSCGGDVLLNIDLFPHGMGSFAVAQIFYISAFGFRPLKWKIGIPLYVMGATLVGVVFKSLEGVLIVGLPLYVTLLLTMCWRSLARAAETKTPLHILCGIGSVLFVVSDALIGIDMFLIQVPNARLWIMITYYVAQFAIALSTATECPKKKSGKLSPKLMKGRNNSAARRRVKSKD